MSELPEGLEEFVARAGWGDAAIEPLTGDGVLPPIFPAAPRNWL